ncbi:hypothetical protein PR048_027823 [Dryococelus australis]|uniref:Uncharacterized protein n=1 Tax=Dryococelus australis TaxID=614101 RepID=A0ABQ9GHJ7_9NEOP|nr:hypothetical protein PR048_027823 [Dryococelus australis]
MNGQFRSIPLTDNTKMTSINQQQLLSSVADNLKKKAAMGYGEKEIQNICTRFQLNAAKIKKMLIRTILTIATVFLKN